MTKFVKTEWAGGVVKNYGPFASEDDAVGFSNAIFKLKDAGVEDRSVKDVEKDWGISVEQAAPSLIAPGDAAEWPTEIDEWPAFLRTLEEGTSDA